MLDLPPSILMGTKYCWVCHKLVPVVETHLDEFGFFAHEDCVRPKVAKAVACLSKT
jgi:hypothetical protein